MHFETAELSKLAADLEAGAAKVEPNAAAVVKKVAFDIEAAAKLAAPVDTGDLQGSISTDIGGDGLSAEIGPTVEYGYYVEYGTHNEDESVRTEPQPYMGPAFDVHSPNLAKALEQVAGKML